MSIPYDCMVSKYNKPAVAQLTKEIESDLQISEVPANYRRLPNRRNSMRKRLMKSR
jgi:hypothetical protein